MADPQKPHEKDLKQISTLTTTQNLWLANLEKPNSNVSSSVSISIRSCPS